MSKGTKVPAFDFEEFLGKFQENLVVEEKQLQSNPIDEIDTKARFDELFSVYFEKTGSTDGEPSFFEEDEEDDVAKTKVAQKIDQVKKVEYSLTDDELANKSLNNVTNFIENEQAEKSKLRNLITYALLIYFLVASILMVIFIHNSNKYDVEVVKIVVGGFFANLAALLMILLKYVYSPSKDLYKYAIDLLTRGNPTAQTDIYLNNQKENKQEE